jgi:hypothetical protein
MLKFGFAYQIKGEMSIKFNPDKQGEHYIHFSMYSV